ncbi:MAG: AAA family ATPase [Kaiparowitsia implicata GSE-PSE-MK54-09C]|jgi:capsular exopolysaccharide synthesis family protein|nr:AAA family ATPase [Kaiparowitsia implicata GSE-PSE-MK54-09C]
MTSTSVKRYWVALDRHKWAGLSGFALVLGLSAIAMLRPAPPARYEARGQLSYLPPPVTVSQTNTALQQGQVVTPEVLLSSFVIDSVIQKLQDQNISADTETLRTNTEIIAAGSRSGGERSSEDISGQRVVVTYQDSNERTAQVTLTLLMETMIEQSRLFNTRQIQRIILNLNDLLPQVTQELRLAEEDLERYIRVEGPTLQSAQDGQVISGITTSQQQQRQIQLNLETIDAQIQSLQSRLGLNADEAYAASALSADPIIADLRSKLYQNETQLQVLSQTLRPEHPTMAELRNQQVAFEQLLQQRVREVVGGRLVGVSTPVDVIRQNSSLDPARQQLANTLVNLQTQRETLVQQANSFAESEQQLRQDYAQIPNKQLEQARLEQQVALKRNFYDQIQSRLADAQLAEEETVGSLVPFQPPQTELVTDPERDTLLILLGGSMVGLLVGAGLVLLLDSLDATFYTQQDLQLALRQREIPLLGLLPALPAAEDEADLPLVLDLDSPLQEAYERLRVNVRRLVANRPTKLVVLTSLLEGEGKTVTAYNLAIASAAAGKRTLLIEADLRSPSQAHVLGIMPNPDNALEPLRYYGRSEFSLAPAVANLYVLPSPGPKRQAAAILDSSELRQLLNDARGRFDLVVIDTPALSQYNDALLIEPHTDGLILVTRPGYTEETLLTDAIDQFVESEDLQFLGAVINDADEDGPLSDPDELWEPSRIPQPQAREASLARYALWQRGRLAP